MSSLIPWPGCCRTGVMGRKVVPPAVTTGTGMPPAFAWPTVERK